jgi:MFS family permease
MEIRRPGTFGHKPAMSIQPAPRSVYALLGDRTVGWYFAGKLSSTCGIWIQNIAAAVLMYELTDSPLMVGIVSVAQFLGPLVLAMWAGALSDRVDRRRVLMAGRTLSGFAATTLGILIATFGVGGFGGPVVIVLTVLVLGVGMAVSVPAMQAIVPSLAAPEDLEPALALSSAAPSIGRAVGPAIGSGLLVFGGPALAFGVAGASHLLFVIILAFIHPRQSQVRPKERPRLLGGVRYLMSNRRTGLLILAVAGLGIGADAVVTLGPPKAEALGGGTAVVGLLASTFGLGAVMGLVLLGPLRRRWTLRAVGTGGFWLLAVGLTFTGFSTTIVLATVGMLLAGAGFMLGTVTLNTRIQRWIPDELRGRIMALWVVAFAGARPVAALINGSVAQWASVRAAYVVGAVITVAAIPLVRVRFQQGSAPTPSSRQFS